MLLVAGASSSTIVHSTADNRGPAGMRQTLPSRKDSQQTCNPTGAKDGQTEQSSLGVELERHVDAVTEIVPPLTSCPGPAPTWSFAGLSNRSEKGACQLGKVNERILCTQASRAQAATCTMWIPLEAKEEEEEGKANKEKEAACQRERVERFEMAGCIPRVSLPFLLHLHIPCISTHTHARIELIFPSCKSR